MQNFIFSLNATIPIFIVILLGWWLYQIKMLNDNFITVANKFVFNVSLPTLLFRDIAYADIRSDFDLKFVLFCMTVTTLCFLCIWLAAELFIKDKKMIGAFVQASFRGSAAVLGIAFIENIYGNSGMGPLMIVAAVPLYNIYSVIILTLKGELSENGGSSIKSAFINICKNPIILAIFAGLPFSILGITFPDIFTKTLNNIAATATPIALITIGAGFEGRKALSKIKPTLAAVFIKLVALPAIFLPVAAAMGFRTSKLIAILIMLGAPTTVSCYIMAKNMYNDDVLTSSIIVCATLISAITLTFWIYLLKTFSLI